MSCEFFLTPINYPPSPPSGKKLVPAGAPLDEKEDQGRGGGGGGLDEADLGHGQA